VNYRASALRRQRDLARDLARRHPTPSLTVC